MSTQTKESPSKSVTILVELHRHLVIMEGCGEAIDRDDNNSPAVRHYGRNVIREVAQVRDLIAALLRAERL